MLLAAKPCFCSNPASAIIPAQHGGNISAAPHIMLLQTPITAPPHSKHTPDAQPTSHLLISNDLIPRPQLHHQAH
jgi:hypothetical protein